MQIHSLTNKQNFLDLMSFKIKMVLKEGFLLNVFNRTAILEEFKVIFDTKGFEELDFVLEELNFYKENNYSAEEYYKIISTVKNLMNYYSYIKEETEIVTFSEFKNSFKYKLILKMIVNGWIFENSLNYLTYEIERKNKNTLFLFCVLGEPTNQEVFHSPMLLPLSENSEWHLAFFGNSNILHEGEFLSCHKAQFNLFDNLLQAQIEKIRADDKAEEDNEEIPF